MSEEIKSPFDKEVVEPTVDEATIVAEVAPEPTVAEVKAEAPVGAVVDPGTAKEEVVPAEAVATGAEEASAVGSGETTPASTDYSKYASMAETPTANERRQFNYISLSGGVETEVITTDQGDVEKRKPAKAFKLFFTEERDDNGNAKSEELDLPLTVVPIKYRVVMEHKIGEKSEIKVLGTSEFNGKNTDLILVYKYAQNAKGKTEIVETFGPMTALQARKKFVNDEGKQLLRDRVRLYSMVGGELVQFVVKGTGLWEKESDLHKGKTDASRSKYPFLSRYLSEFAINDPYFLYEMKVDAAYRDHGAIKYYRPTFTRGARISPEAEVTVLEHLEDLYKYFEEMDKATEAYVPEVKTEETPVTTEPATDVPFGSDAPADGDY